MRKGKGISDWSGTDHFYKRQKLTPNTAFVIDKSGKIYADFAMDAIRGY